MPILPLALLVALLPLVTAAGWLSLVHGRHAGYHRHKQLPAPLGGLGPAARYHLRELVAMGLLASWYLRPHHAAALRGRPVLFVHGWTQHPSNFRAMRAALEQAGRPTAAVWLGLPGRRLSGYVPRLERALRGLAESSPDGFDVVAHSMGGVVLRMVLAKHPELAASVRHVVTLGTPHRGTASSRGLAWLEAADLHRRSDLMRDLPDFRALAPHASVTTIGAEHDLIVYPPETCHLPGCRQIVLPEIGHAGLLVDRRAVEAVREAVLDEPAAQVGQR